MLNSEKSGSMHYHAALPVTCEGDVVVVGAGPSGMAAAIASARSGAGTILVEKNGYAGGMATAGLVAPMMKCFSIDGGRQIIKGIFDEIVRRMEEIGGAIHPERVQTGSSRTGFLIFGQDHVTPFDPEALKWVADRMLSESGVEVLFHSQFIDAIVEGAAIAGIVIANKSGMQVVRGKVVIDCTGDADVAARAGVPFQIGRREDGVLQPATLMCRVYNVDSEKTKKYVRDNPDDFMFMKIAERAREAGDFPINRRRAIIQETVHPGQWNVNSTRIHNLDATDAKAMSAAEMEGRRQVDIVVKYLRNYIPGFENAVLMDSGHEMGVRESRHIEGEYTLTLDDVMKGTPFEDCIALCGFNVDIHDPSGKKDQFIEPECQEAYQIPYRCLVPRGIENLLVAGRPVSATHEAAAAIRVMPPCFAMGQAAGIAAALAVKSHCSTAQVSVHELRELLSRNNACVGL